MLTDGLTDSGKALMASYLVSLFDFLITLLLTRLSVHLQNDTNTKPPT